MRTFLKLAIVQTKLYLREPMGVFFHPVIRAPDADHDGIHLWQ